MSKKLTLSETNLLLAEALPDRGRTMEEQLQDEGSKAIEASDAEMRRLEELMLPYVFGSKSKDSAEWLELSDKYLGEYRLNCFLHGEAPYR